MLRSPSWSEVPSTTSSISLSVNSDQLGERSIAALERYRDDTLLAVLDAVKTSKAKHGMAFGD